MSSLKIGIVGLSAGGSWASRSHLKALKARSTYEITALQNSSKASAEKSSSAYDLPNIGAYGSPDELAKDPNVDLVLVSVKVPDHAPIIKSILTAPTPKDIFVEWPLAKNLSEAIELTDLAKKAGVRTMVGLQARFNPSILKAKEIVASGELGDIMSTTMKGYGILYPLWGPMPTSYEYTLDQSLGATLLTIPFGHAVDAMCFVLGEFESLQATLLNLRSEVPIVAEGSTEVLRTTPKTAHDSISVQGSLVNGGGLANVVFLGGNGPSGQGFSWEITGTKASLRFEGPSGHIQMFQPTIEIIKHDVEKAQYEKIAVKEIGNDVSYNVGQAWDDFASKDVSDPTTFEDAVMRHKMIDAILKSSANGTRESYL